MQQSIVLIGFMGAGKTAVARELASLTGAATVNVDAEIERLGGKSIPEIFTTDGEEHFRALETAALGDLRRDSARIIDAGGGAVVRNSALLTQLGTVIWLRGPNDELWTRVSGSDGRPLATSREDFTRLYEEREPLYRAAAHHVVEISGKMPSQIAAEIVQLTAQ